MPFDASAPPGALQNMTVDQIVDWVVARPYHSVSRRELEAGTRREPRLAYARFHAFYLLRKYRSEFSLQSHAYALGITDHASVIYGIERWKDAAGEVDDPGFNPFLPRSGQ